MLLELVNCKNEMHICLATFSDLVKGFSSLFMILPSMKVILPLPLPCITIITHALTNTWREISTLLSAVLAPVLPAVYPTPILLTFGVSFTPTFIPHSQKQIFQICEIFWTFQFFTQLDFLSKQLQLVVLSEKWVELVTRTCSNQIDKVAVNEDQTRTSQSKR